jgi:hypothetical protein
MEVAMTFFSTFLSEQVEAGTIKSKYLEVITEALNKKKEELEKGLLGASGTVVDTTAPKRPTSAYIEFSKLHRDEVKVEGMKITQVAKALGALWTEAKVKGHKYHKEYQKLTKDFEEKKVEYQQAKKEHKEPEMAVLVEKDLAELKKAPARKGKGTGKVAKPRVKKPKGFPKQPRSAGQLYRSAETGVRKLVVAEWEEWEAQQKAEDEEYKTDTKEKTKWINARIKELWEEVKIDPKQLAKWTKMAKQDEERHAGEMETWLEEHPEDQEAEDARLAKKAKADENKASGKSKAKPKPKVEPVVAPVASTEEEDDEDAEDDKPVQEVRPLPKFVPQVQAKSSKAKKTVKA